MTALLELLDAEGDAPVHDDLAVDFGDAHLGATIPRRLRVRNAGDEVVYFARLRAVPHPTDQTGASRDTFAATTFARTQDGAFTRELELGTLAPAEERAFWVRWTVPRGALPGPVAWAVEALGST